MIAKAAKLLQIIRKHKHVIIEVQKPVYLDRLL